MPSMKLPDYLTKERLESAYQLFPGQVVGFYFEPNDDYGVARQRVAFLGKDGDVVTEFVKAFPATPCTLGDGTSTRVRIVTLDYFEDVIAPTLGSAGILSVLIMDIEELDLPL